jgi:osmotically-inducible protein OsmY
VMLPGHAERSDPEISEAVRRALEWDVLVPDKQIHSTVSGGIVTLRGELDAAEASLDAVRAIRNLVGVRAVVNKIELRVPTVNKNDIEQAIKGALERRADREAEQIELEIEGDSVTLTGTVHSAAERLVAIGAARGTRGVSTVIDHLHVEQ